MGEENEKTVQFFAAYKLADVNRFSDPEQKLYRAFELNGATFGSCSAPVFGGAERKPFSQGMASDYSTAMASKCLARLSFVMDRSLNNSAMRLPLTDPITLNSHARFKTD